MKQKKPAKGTHGEFPLRDYMAVAGTVSATDCTGAVPSGSVDSAGEFSESNKLKRYSKAKKINNL